MIDTMTFILIWLGGMLAFCAAAVFFAVFIIHLADVVDDLFDNWRRK